MMNNNRCSCGSVTEPDVPGTPGPDGEDFVNNDYLFATQDGEEWYDADEHAKRRYVQPDPEINESVYSLSEEACQSERCTEPCGEAADCGEACGCEDTCGCADLCDACGCETAYTVRRTEKTKCDAGRAREESIRRNQARAAQRRQMLQNSIDAEERQRRRENALKHSCAPCQTDTQAYRPEPELSFWPESLYLSASMTAENSCGTGKRENEQAALSYIPVSEPGPVCGYPGDPCETIEPKPTNDFFQEEGEIEAQSLYMAPEEDIYGKAERFTEDNAREGCGCSCGPEGNGGDGAEDCEVCCKGEDCYAPDYYACELDEDCCNPESAFLMQGSFGDEVRALQRCVKSIPEEQGGAPVLEVDGIYGPNTAMAVMRFQEQHDIPADGVTNKKTRARMQRLCQSR